MLTSSWMSDLLVDKVMSPGGEQWSKQSHTKTLKKMTEYKSIEIVNENTLDPDTTWTA